MPKTFTRTDLKTYYKTNRTLPNGGTVFVTQPILYCHECGQEFSANPSDYWDTPDDRIMSHCDEPMDLVMMHRDVLVSVDRVEEFDEVLAVFFSDEIEEE